MVKFILKGLVRDRSRSFFPTLIVLLGVALTVLIFSWMKGVIGGAIRASAAFDTGHVKIMSRAYGELSDQIPNDLALDNISQWQAKLESEFGRMIWTPRIRFGGLLDLPDENGETRAQGPVMGIAIDLFSPESPEYKILNLQKAIVQGKLPKNPGEILISEEFARKIEAKIGDTATLITSTMYGSTAFYNFIIAGTVRFGIGPMDKGAMLADIADIRIALNMEDTAGEILGFFPNYIYDEQLAVQIVVNFNAKYSHENDEYSPVMFSLKEQSGMALYFDMAKYEGGIIISIFIFVMSIVLWNAGLMGSLRRYGEIGLRLAIGENKGQVYRLMIYESVLVGFIGSILGTIMGLGISYYLQVKGVDMSSMMKSSAMMISNVFRAKVTTTCYYIGFIPGLLATILGTMISGIGIYKRQTSHLFKELEV